MEPEVKAGIERFREALESECPGIQLVIPVRPTGANFLISLTSEGMRTYITIHEDDFADWGEASETPDEVFVRAAAAVQKLLGSG